MFLNHKSSDIKLACGLKSYSFILKGSYDKSIKSCSFS